jgi:hypothetical protein
VFFVYIYAIGCDRVFIVVHGRGARATDEAEVPEPLFPKPSPARGCGALLELAGIALGAKAELEVGNFRRANAGGSE